MKDIAKWERNKSPVEEKTPQVTPYDSINFFLHLEKILKFAK